MNSLYNIHLQCIVLTTRQELNKQYVLSLDKDAFSPPTMVLEDNNTSNIENNLIKFVQTKVLASDLELIPQLIQITKSNTDDNTIDIVYGFLIRYNENLNDVHWIEFNLAEEKPYSSLILHVIQKL